MNHFAGYIRTAAKTLRGGDLKATREQLDFLGDDNELANRSAVLNLMDMGKRKARYLYTGAPSGLEALLPGVKVHVLGPPTLEQDPRVATQTDKQADEFWHLRASFWARRGALARQGSRAGKPLFPAALLERVPWDARWYAYKAQRELADSLLSIVRTLDDAMNNTSLNLLFEVGKTCLLFPGDGYTVGELALRARATEVSQAAGARERLQGRPPRQPERHAEVDVDRAGQSGRQVEARPTPVTALHQGSCPRQRRRPHRSTPQVLVNALEKDSTLIDTRKTEGADLRITHDLALG